MANSTEIKEIVRVMKAHPLFVKLQQYVDLQLEEARGHYENTPASEFLRGRVSILKQLKQDLEG